MVTTYVWLPKTVGAEKNVGHTSILVGPQTYISWWPAEPARLWQDHHPIRNKDYASDVADEQGRPDFSILLVGLDEERIIEWWSMFGLVRGGTVLEGPMLPYNLLTQNCSTVVARGLKVGGADHYAGWYVSHCLVWRPRTVLDYAMAIQRGLAKRQAQRG